jgi:CBS domain-containing protein
VEAPGNKLGCAVAKAFEDLLVADLMSSEIITCSRDADLATVAATLARRGVHAVFVLGDRGDPAGVVSDFDLLAGEWLGDDSEGLRAMRTITAGELMTSPVEAIRSDAPAEEAAARMRELHLSRLLVSDEHGSAVGVISVSDLVAPLGRPSVQRRCVGDVMSHGIVTCPPDSTLHAACRAMIERRSRSIVVVDEHGHAVGVLTGTDLLSLYQSGDADGTVADLMTPPITCAPELSLSDAADLMISQEVHRIVVVDPARPDAAPIGVVSTSDIVAEMADERSVWHRADD